MIKYPWRERNSRFSPLKAVCFGALFLPALWVLGLALLGQLSARPIKEAILDLGLWAIRLQFLALAITPLRMAWRWKSLVLVRRMIHSMFLFEVKKPEELKGPWDYYKVLAEVPGDQAFRPLKDGGCPLVK